MPVFLYIRHDACLSDAWTKRKWQKNIEYDEGKNYLRAKSETLFTSIGTKYGIEQGNQALKVFDGVKGIANSTQNLDKYFLSAVKMGNIILWQIRYFRRSVVQNGKIQRTKESETTFVK